MRFSVAAFGDIGRGHGLLGCTPDHRTLFQEIINRTDRPGSVPPGLVWLPYLSGFSYKTHYFLMRTFPDEGASRSGMVYTFVVAAAMPEFCAIDNLQAVVSALPTVLSESTDQGYGAIEIADVQIKERPSGVRVPPELAQALVTVPAPVVWADPESFDAVVVGLWSAVWPPMRRHLSFRLSFDPRDIDVDCPPTLVTTPKQVRVRWTHSSIVFPRTVGEHFPVSEAAAVLCGDQLGDSVRQVRDELEADITELRQLTLIAAIAEAQRNERQTFSLLRSQLQLTAKLAPAKSQGSEFKSSLLAQASIALPLQDTAAEIRGLRNIPWECFDEQLTDRVLERVTEWLRTNLIANTINGDDVIPLLRDGLRDTNRWASSVRAGLEQALASDDSRAARAVWTWLMAGLELLGQELFWSYLRDQHWESNFADVCPALDGIPQLAESLIASSHQRGCFELHAAVLKRTKTPERAVFEHLAALPPTSTIGLERLREGVGESEFLALSVRIKDERLIDSALKCLESDPSLWGQFDSTEGFWHSIFKRAFEVLGRIYFRGGPGSIVVARLVGSLGSISINQSLLKDVVEVQPDWSGFQVTSEAWDRLPEPQRSTVLGATAEGVLKQFLRNELNSLPASSELGTYLVNDARVRTSLADTRNPGRSVELFEELSDLTEQTFTWWISSVLRQGPTISDVTSLRIGELINSRRWRNAASEVARLAEWRKDLRPAIQVCFALFGMLRRAQLYVSGVLKTSGEIDIWAALQELGLELYAYGPGVNDLWSRAGGHQSDLPNFRSGREAWSTLIAEARAGRHNVTQRTLTHAMMEDYPWNADLKRIEQLLNEE